MRTYYRRCKGWDGKIYRVRIPPQDIRGLITTWTLISAAVTSLLCFAAFLYGLAAG